jgi:hypothetical protein
MERLCVRRSPAKEEIGIYEKLPWRSKIYVKLNYIPQNTII